ncbi:uncharacterized protein CG3556 [Contarinia nasturtii]|uniref:uncharacterized protein CG3556 n=1 Tax=Contarinia nasturtii TaxID=265458 RepID=UPI0012D483B4|nr:uncharacterized protein CG3556 [Contarinia nasturtii]XP_031635117.1 uncharacterized protein CG3556 [Contarinia nasturtii]
MDHAKLLHKITLSIVVWMFAVTIIISGINAVSLVSTSTVTATATSNPIFQLNSTGTSSEFSRTPSSWPSSSQKAVRVMGSTESDSVSYNTLESTSSNSIPMQSPEFSADESPLTVIEIENPFGEHVYIGTKGPNQRESEAITRALDWLGEKRFPDYGWGNDTHMVILAKELSGERDFAESTDAHIQIIQTLEDQLSIKQMSIEILSLIDHHHHAVMPRNFDVAELALFTLALGALCKDPKHFMNQHDLLTMLQHHESNDDQIFALSTFAVCSLGEHVRKRQIRQLIDIALENNQSIETTAFAILALRCVMNDHHNRHLEHFLRKSSLRLALMQTTQGNVGTLRSTALAMQALQDLNVIPSAAWSRAAASKWILDRQHEDGSWSEFPLSDGQDANMGIGLTAHIILALGRKGLSAVRMLECNNILSDTSGFHHEVTEQKLASPVPLTPSSASVPEINIQTVSFTYTIWFSLKPPVDTVSLAMTSPRNTTFYQAMVQAMDIDPRFAFESHEWPNGHYIRSIGGHSEDLGRFNYWLLYKLPDMPDINKLPENKFINSIGVDEMIVENNYHYLYWYKKL